MTERFDAGPVLATLKEFQRATVDHVADRLYGHGGARRFLVADETGLGKSIVAKGLIARAIEHLEVDETVDRIDVVYVCSNAEIAEQNLSRLDVTGDEHLPFASRLTLLAKDSARLASHQGRFTKPVNLISFTPGTSFDMGWQTGMAEERALIYLLVEQALDLAGSRARAAQAIFQGGVQRLETFRSHIARLETHTNGELDPVVAEKFRVAAEEQGLLSQLEEEIDELGRRWTLSTERRSQLNPLIGSLRATLARASVDTLEPDLIILDEFQRFRHLLDPSNGGPAAELAHVLFEYGEARVLLLSATPYKPFTYAEESVDGDDHYRDFLRTLEFLTDGDESELAAIRADLHDYRHAAIAGTGGSEVRERLRRRLLQVMCRTERPQFGRDDMLTECLTPADEMRPRDLVNFVGLRRLGDELRTPFSPEYWKSAPYFANFGDGYRLGDELRSALADGERRERISPLIEQVDCLNPKDLRRFVPVDMGNARLRRLADETVGAGWWQLLWVPPSLPYLEPSGPYAEAWASSMTKRLVFSSWVAAPTAIACLLSYEADRSVAEGTKLTDNTTEGRESLGAGLDYRVDGERAATMSTLALMWPNPALAHLCDPLVAARRDPGAPRMLQEVEREVVEALAPWLGPDGMSSATISDAWYWAASLGLKGSLPEELGENPHRIEWAMGGGRDRPDPDDEADLVDPSRLARHVEQALRLCQGEGGSGDRPTDLLATVASIGLHGPGNVAWRALDRVLTPGHQVTPSCHWEAAAVLASGMRSLFNRPEAMLLLGRIDNSGSYWRSVLRYCAAGNLQAVLDEYIHHLANAEGTADMTDKALMGLARRARDALALRVSPYQAFDPKRRSGRVQFAGRFALRYGNKKQTEDLVRQPLVRNAFNSPFWPHVLATTSIGQEGIDLHWWCRAVVHWNTPSNPVDFEQREGRVNRYAGLAIRRNIAYANRAQILGRTGRSVWDDAYDVASEGIDRQSGLAPHWVYPGPWKIERHLYPYPVSSDRPRIERMKDDLALYRLTFGQPRQEDLLALLERRGVADSEALVQELQLDLQPRGTRDD